MWDFDFGLIFAKISRDTEGLIVHFREFYRILSRNPLI
jgi:hypothetical protein